MKAISLHQPWATAIALGAKRVETRGWGTKYRGPIAIHAAKRCNVNELIGVSATWSWCGALNRKMGGADKLWETLPFGAVVAVAWITDCRPTESFTIGEIEQWRMPVGEAMPPREKWDEGRPSLYAWTERMMGDFGLGRFGWTLEDVQPLTQPLPWKGKQGFFDVPVELLNPLVPDWFVKREAA